MKVQSPWKWNVCTQKLFWRGLFISITCHGGFAHKLSTISKQKSMEKPWKICGKTQKNTTREKCKHSFPHNKNGWKHKHTHSQRKSLDWLGAAVEHFSDPLSSDMRVHVEINKQFISNAKRRWNRTLGENRKNRVLAKWANKPRQNENINNIRLCTAGGGTKGGMANGKTWNSYLKIRALPAWIHT